MRLWWLIPLVAGIVMLIFHAPLTRHQREFQKDVLGTVLDEDWQRPTEIFYIVVGIVFIVGAVVMLAGFGS